MADVMSGSGWVGTPPADGQGLSRRRGVPVNNVNGAAPAPAAAPGGTMGAFGLTPEQTAANQTQTGVNAGGTGYTSGQVAPSGIASQALAAPRTDTSGGTAPATSTPPPAGSGYRVNHTGPVQNISPFGGPTFSSVAGGDTTTTQSALSVSSPAARGDAGTSNQNTGTYKNPALVSTGNEGLDRVLDPGGIFKGAVQVDTGPARAAQSAAFGIQDNLDRERYDYRPGAAASQDRVALDKAQAEETRARQNQAYEALTAAANGTVPSAAELQLQRQSGKNIAATLGQARALGGRSAGGAARAGTLASADILANTNAEGAQLRAAEQANARNQQMQAALGIRGQDIDTASADAKLAQEANANNLRSQLEQNELAERRRQMLLQAQLQALGIGAGAAGSIMNAGSKNADAENKFNGGILDTVGGIFGS